MSTPPPEFCFLWIEHWSTCMAKEHWAAWVQAIFSVVAIAAAVALSYWQWSRDRTRETAREREAARLQMGNVIVLVSKAYTMMLSIPRPGTELTKAISYFEKLRIDDFDRLSELLASIGFRDVPDSGALIHLLDLRKTFNDVRGYASLVRSHIRHNRVVPNNWLSYTNANPAIIGEWETLVKPVIELSKHGEKLLEALYVIQAQYQR